MIAYDPSSALVVVDVQNDFADPAGSLYVRGGQEVVPFVNAQIEEAVAAGALAVFTQDWHPEMTPHFHKDGGIWPVHCVQETWGAAFHPDLRVEGPVVRKGADGRDGYSGFSVRDPLSGDVEATQLETLLRERGTEHVVICGLATDYCVVETALDALRLGFATTVLPEGIRAVDLQAGDGERALERMREAGAILV
ncbi:MAG: isochorismatase family protein [Gaiellaceae bacterium]